MYGVLTDVKRRRRFAATPMGGTIARLLPRGSQNPGTQSRGQYAGRLPGMKGIEAIEPILKKTLLPENDRRCGGLQALLDGAEGRALGQQQDQFGAKDVSRRQAARLSDGSQFGMLILGEQEFVASSHTKLEAQNLVMVTLRQATSDAFNLFPKRLSPHAINLRFP
jgi:hypothetical protein